MSQQYKNILKYLSLFGSIQGLNLLAGLLRSKITALILGPGGMGLVSLLNTAVTALSSATNLGVSFAAVKDIAETKEPEALLRKVAAIRTWSLIAAALGAAVTVAVAPLIDTLTFNWGNHTLHYLTLAPTVAALAVTGGETAILRATRKIKNLAEVQIATVFLSLAITIPIYYYYGESGISAVIFLTALATTVATLVCSTRHFPYQISGVREHVRSGGPMVRLGLSFAAAGIMGSATELYIRSFLNTRGDLETVGLYYAAMTMAITYPSAIFSSLENDYFARLSAINHDNRRIAVTVNAQIEVMLMVMCPIIAVLLVALPIAIPLLFSSKFSGAIPMAQLALLAMFLKTATTPIEYIPLAKGLPKTYMAIELTSNVLIAAAITVGYNTAQLQGAGAAWIVVYLVALIVILVVARLQWGFTLSRKAAAILIAEAAALGGVYYIL